MNERFVAVSTVTESRIRGYDMMMMEFSACNHC